MSEKKIITLSGTPETRPRYPIFIVSKGRHESMLTSRSLARMKVPHYIIIEPQDEAPYEHALDKFDINPYATLLVAPFSNHGDGSGRARNWTWDYSIHLGHERHWVLDDNITDFYRLHKNERIRIETGAGFRAMEDFVDRFENIALAGPQYRFFCPSNQKQPAFVKNTRLMSCILIKNDLPFRWRGKYNEDVDLSLRALKAGYCTILFYAFLQGKAATLTVKGGNTEELYGGGLLNLEKSKMLVNLHPDCVKLVKRYGRWHHDCDMSAWKDNKLIIKSNAVFPEEPNEYGLKLVENYGDGNNPEYEEREE